MFDRFTGSAIKSIMLAQEESRRLGHNFVGTEQILIGLIREDSGTASQALTSMGVGLADAQQQVEKIIGRGSGRVAEEVPFTPRAKRLLEFSWNEAKELGSKQIDTEHLLLGLIATKESAAIRVLENLNVVPQKLRERVLELRG